jgi:hypothetical protein
VFKAHWRQQSSGSKQVENADQIGSASSTLRVLHRSAALYTTIE